MPYVSRSFGVLSMIVKGNFISFFFAALTGVICSTHVYAATPSPPSTICIDGSCTQSTSIGGSKAIKFNPGHYAWYDAIFYKEPSRWSGKRSGLLSFIDSIANEPTIKGVQITVQWSVLEGDTAGTYTGFTDSAGNQLGFAFIDEVVSRLARYNKKLMLVLGSYQIGGFSAPGELSFPKYLMSTTYGTQQAYNASGYRYGGVVVIPTGSYSYLTNGEITPAFWESRIADRIIALQAAYGNRYNNNAVLEMWSPISNLAFTTPYETFGYTRSATATQTARILSAARSAWPNTAVRLWLDYFDNDAGTAAVISHAASVKAAIGGNDVLPGEDVTADRVFNGESGGTDYRGVIPWVSNVAVPELCGKEGTYTASQLFIHAMDGNANTGIRPQRPQYMAWITSEACSGSAQRWSTGILPFIRSINGAVSTGLDSTRRTPETIKSSFCLKGYTDGCK